MKRSKLRNLYLKKKTDTSRIAYIKQRTYCVSLLRKTKINHYANLNDTDVADNSNSGGQLNHYFQMKKHHR